MSEYITTYTGAHFKPTEPEPELIRVEDIAHALSMICRGNGHVQTFWSVAEHCICCAKEAAARGLPDRMVFACLLHDASECYMSDVPTPFKKQLPEYEEREERLLRMIYEKFLGSALTEEEQEQLDEIDHALVLYDLEVLLKEKQEEKPELHINLDYTVRPFDVVEAEYLRIFRKYYEKCRKKQRAAMTSENKQDDLYRVLQSKGYPDDFCREVAYRQMNTEYTATRMLGYLYRISAPSPEDVVDEMLAILSDRNAIIQKKELEHAQATINSVYRDGL